MYKTEDLPLLKCDFGLMRLSQKQFEILLQEYDYKTICNFTYDQASKRIGKIIKGYKEKRKNYRLASWEEVMYIEGAEPFDR